MDRAPFAFDAVLFDLDGTLVATERYWPDAARAGARIAFRELGLERAPPTSAEWMSMVGLPLDEGFDAVFSDLTRAERVVIQGRCEEAEQALLHDGRAALLPGVLETLEELRARGVRTAVASNCGQEYLEAVWQGVGLAQRIDAARCLDSPGIGNKADMLEDLLRLFDTRSAVMVGDRRGDRDAAWANGLPHVHLSRGYAAAGEEFECEALIEGMHALLPRLERRGAWLDGALTDLLGAGSTDTRTIGVTGGVAAGKGLFARDLARMANARGREGGREMGREMGYRATTLSLDMFRRTDTPVGPAQDPLPGAWALEILLGEVLEPHARGRAVAVEAPGGRVTVPADSLLILEGPFLLHPRLRGPLDRVVHLFAQPQTVRRRVAGRDGRPPGEGALALQRAFEDHFPAAELADLVLDASNALGPA